MEIQGISGLSMTGSSLRQTAEPKRSVRTLHQPRGSKLPAVQKSSRNSAGQNRNVREEAKNAEAK